MPIAIALAPMLIQAALEIYKTLHANETDAEKKVHYSVIISALEDANDEVQASPLPDDGSGV